MKKMKGILFTIVLAAALGCLTGCTFGLTTSYIYANGEKYTAGDRDITEKIENIDIDYLSGEVVLTAAGTDTVSIRETANEELDEQRKVHTWVDGSTLYVRYCASAKKLKLEKLEKHLEITIPEGTALTDLKGKISSGDLKLDGFEAGNVNLTASSGNITAVGAAKNYNLHASSGDVYLGQRGESDEILISTSSGSIEANIDNADKADVHASSGKIVINAGNIRDFKSETSSGDNEFHFTEAPDISDIGVSSGDVTIFLPVNAGLTADLSVSSGVLLYDLPFAKSGDRYVCGDGKNQMKVHTSSGDLSIKVQ